VKGLTTKKYMMWTRDHVLLMQRQQAPPGRFQLVGFSPQAEALSVAACRMVDMHVVSGVRSGLACSWHLFRTTTLRAAVKDDRSSRNQSRQYRAVWTLLRRMADAT
jgi:hypothetical protein